MSPDQPFAEKPAPFARAFAALLTHGRDLVSRIQSAITHKTPLPKRYASNPITAEQRIVRTLTWITALARTLAGDRTWLITPSYVFPRWPHRFPPLTAKLREEIGLPPIPPRTEAQKAAAHLWYVKKVFATQPVAKIAARLARRLDLAESAAAWPADLIQISQTPAAWAKSARAGIFAFQPPPPPSSPEATRDPPPPIATGPP